MKTWMIISFNFSQLRVYIMQLWGKKSELWVYMTQIAILRWPSELNVLQLQKTHANRKSTSQSRKHLHQFDSRCCRCSQQCVSLFVCVVLQRVFLICSALSSLAHRTITVFIFLFSGGIRFGIKRKSSTVIVIWLNAHARALTAARRNYSNACPHWTSAASVPDDRQSVSQSVGDGPQNRSSTGSCARSPCPDSCMRLGSGVGERDGRRREEGNAISRRTGAIYTRWRHVSFSISSARGIKVRND